MAEVEKLRQYVQLLGDEAQLFCACPGPERANNILNLCEHIEAAIEGYMFQLNMEEINGEKQTQ